MVSNTQPPYNIISTVDRVATRAFDTVYTNNSGRTMFVLMSGYFTVTVAANQILLRAMHSFTPGGGLESMAWAGMDNTIAALIGARFFWQLTMIVPPGCTYELYHETFGGTSTLINWLESY